MVDTLLSDVDAAGSVSVSGVTDTGISAGDRLQPASTNEMIKMQIVSTKRRLCLGCPAIMADSSHRCLSLDRIIRHCLAFVNRVEFEARRCIS